MLSCRSASDDPENGVRAGKVRIAALGKIVPERCRPSATPRGLPRTILVRRPTEDATRASKCSQRPTLDANFADVPIQLTMPAYVMLRH